MAYLVYEIPHVSYYKSIFNNIFKFNAIEEKKKQVKNVDVNCNYNISSNVFLISNIDTIKYNFNLSTKSEYNSKRQKSRNKEEAEEIDNNYSDILDKDKEIENCNYDNSINDNNDKEVLDELIERNVPITSYKSTFDKEINFNFDIKNKTEKSNYKEKKRYSNHNKRDDNDYLDINNKTRFDNYLSLLSQYAKFNLISININSYNNSGIVKTITTELQYNPNLTFKYKINLNKENFCYRSIIKEDQVRKDLLSLRERKSDKVDIKLIKSDNIDINSVLNEPNFDINDINGIKNNENDNDNYKKDHSSSRNSKNKQTSFLSVRYIIPIVSEKKSKDSVKSTSHSKLKQEISTDLKDITIKSRYDHTIVENSDYSIKLHYINKYSIAHKYLLNSYKKKDNNYNKSKDKGNNRKYNERKNDKKTINDDKKLSNENEIKSEVNRLINSAYSVLSNNCVLMTCIKYNLNNNKSYGVIDYKDISIRKDKSNKKDSITTHIGILKDPKKRESNAFSIITITNEDLLQSSIYKNRICNNKNNFRDSSQLNQSLLSKLLLNIVVNKNTSNLSNRIHTTETTDTIDNELSNKSLNDYLFLLSSLYSFNKVNDSCSKLKSEIHFLSIYNLNNSKKNKKPSNILNSSLCFKLDYRSNNRASISNSFILNRELEISNLLKYNNKDFFIQLILNLKKERLASYGLAFQLNNI